MSYPTNLSGRARIGADVSRFLCSSGAILSGALEILVVPGLRLSSKSTSQLGGNPGRSSGKTSGHSFTMGTNDESSFFIRGDGYIYYAVQMSLLEFPGFAG